MKPNKAAIFFIGLAYWTIFLGFLTWTVTHYYAIFHARETPGPLRDFNSWQIGIVIEGGYALFQFFFMRIRGKSKYFFLVVLLGLIYFFQFQYYEATEPVMWKRLIFAAVFPFILSMFAWMGNKMKELKESMAHGAGTKRVNTLTSSRYSKEEMEILESAGVNLDGGDAGPGSGAPESEQPEQPEPQTIKVPEFQGHSHGKNQMHPKTLMRKFGMPLLKNKDGSVKCQYCGETAANVQAMRRIHSLIECFMEWYETKQKEVNDVDG